MHAGGIRVLVVASLLVACSSTAPATPTPSASSAPTPSPTVEPLRTPPAPASPTLTLTPGHEAELVVTGEGTCRIINYGSCWAVLLLQPAPAGDLFAWVPSDNDFEFAADSSGLTEQLTGPLLSGPTSVAEGLWAVGLGVANTSDIAEEGVSATVLCVEEFDVTAATQRVTIEGNIDVPCQIDVTLAPELEPTDSTAQVPPRPAPEGGVLDDCHSRAVLLRIDADNRPWYEDVYSGQRIDTVSPLFDGYTVKRAGDRATLVDSEGNEGLSELDLTGIECVFQAGDLAWIGVPDTAWDPWDGALGLEGGSAARYLLESGRGHLGGLPPAAATLTSPLATDLDEATLGLLDDEIDGSGAAWWSNVVPGVFVGSRVALPVALGTSDSAADDAEWQWLTFHAH